MFAVEHDDVVPDVLLVGKGFGGGFPVSGIVDPRAYRILQTVGQSQRQLVELWRQSARRGSGARHDPDDRRRRAGRAQRGACGALMLAEMRTLGVEIPIVQRRARRGSDARDGPRRTGNAHAARQEDDALDLRHAARARRDWR